MGLSNYQLVLLDNLIYLDTVVAYYKDQERYTIEEVVHKLLYADGSDEPGTGTIRQDAYSRYNGERNCFMKEEEWVDVLLAIEADQELCALKIHNVEDAGDNGFRAATFISDATKENVIIFRGTFTAHEWVDDGEGGYQVQTENQYKALEYVNVLFQSPILENQRMYAVPNAVGLMIPYYHQPNNIFCRDGGGHDKRKGIDVPIEKTRRKNTICRSLCCNISKETAFYFV